MLTLVTLAAGAALFVAREPMARMQAALVHDWSLERAYRGGMRLLDRTAVEVTVSCSAAPRRRTSPSS